MFDSYKKIIIVHIPDNYTINMPNNLPEFALLIDEDLLTYIGEEDLRCRTAMAAAEEERREDQDQVENTKHRLVNLRLRHDYLLQNLNHPRITPGRRVHIRQEIQEIKGQIDTLVDYLSLYYDLMIVRDQQHQNVYNNLLQAVDELIERNLLYIPR